MRILSLAAIAAAFVVAQFAGTLAASAASDSTNGQAKSAVQAVQPEKKPMQVDSTNVQSKPAAQATQPEKKPVHVEKKPTVIKKHATFKTRKHKVTHYQTKRYKTARYPPKKFHHRNIIDNHRGMY